MKKLLVITDVTLVFTAVLLIFAVKQDEHSVVAPTIEFAKADQYSPAKTVNIEQIKMGNFETIHGIGLIMKVILMAEEHVFWIQK
nr:hypothetical protein [Lactococcus petauri]